jgi:hypothetical protein
MYRKTNIKTLAIVFGILLVLVVLVEMIDIRKGSRTFKKVLIEVNADEITGLELQPKAANGKIIKLVRDNDIWQLESEGRKYNADQNIAGNLIDELNGLKPQSVAAKGKDRWKQYEVTDSLGTHVKLLSGADVLADLIVGKFSYSQPNNMTSYLRLIGDDEVYSVNGLLGMSFNRNLNSFRDRSIVKSASRDWSKLTFTYPADSSFVLEKVDNKWLINNQSVDSTAIANYFSSISNLFDSNFSDTSPEIASTHQLVISGSSGSVSVKGFFVDADNFYIESDQNPGTIFNSPETAKKLFVSPKKFAIK